MRDHTALEMPAFNGLFARGDYEMCPSDRFIEAQNVVFKNDQIKSRDGFTRVVEDVRIVRHYMYQKAGGHARIIYLTTAGDLFDQTVSIVTPILSIAAMTDFSAVTLFDRCYITPHDGDKGLNGQFVYVYDGISTVARKIAGTAPSATGMAAANSATAGNIPAGVHAFGALYETSTGFLSEPGSFVQLTTSGSKKVDLSSIPTGPTGTLARHIVATKLLDNFAGDFGNQEWFFVPSGEIADNTTTTLTINFYDEDLFDSADYLFDILTEVPAGVAIGVYNGRLVITGEYANQHIARVSEEGDPEVFNEIDGFVSTNPNDGASAVLNLLVSRGQLYLFKDYRTFVTTDNGGPAATWNLDKVDSFLGAYAHTIGQTLDTTENSVADMAIIGNSSGLYLFDGKFSDLPLSRNIQDKWDLIDKGNFKKVWIVIDPSSKTVYVPIPVYNELLICNYENGLESATVKWSNWVIRGDNDTTINLRSGTIDVNFTDGTIQFRIGSDTVSNDANGILIAIADKTYDGSDSSIQAHIRFPFTSEGDGINHFGGLRATVYGEGFFYITLYSLSEVATVITALTLADLGGTNLMPMQRLFDFVSWKCSVKLAIQDDTDAWFRLVNAKLFANSLAEEYPNVT